MKNKMELLQAAQTLASSNVNVPDAFTITKNKIAAFQSYGIADEHWPEFSTHADASLASYRSLINQPVKPTAPAQAPAANLAA